MTAQRDERPGVRRSDDTAELYRRYAPAVVRRARRFLQPAEAEEAAHEVFMKLLEDPVTFRGESSPATWLFRVTTRVCIDRLRHRSRQTRLVADAHHAQGERLDPGTRSEARVFLETLWRRLDPELALVGALYYVDGLKQSEIAQTLGVTERTIYTRLTALAFAARAAAGEVR